MHAEFVAPDGLNEQARLPLTPVICYNKPSRKVARGCGKVNVTPIIRTRKENVQRALRSHERDA
ncbi:MAG: hypothetical protein ACJ8LL_13525 [Candidatus Udaeobacter sp.]